MIVNGSLFREIESNSWDAEARLAECDARRRRRAGSLDGAGHVQLLGGARSRARARAVSERPHRRCRGRAPARVSPASERSRCKSPDLAISELERCVRRPRALGRRDRLERQRSESRQPGALSDLRGGRVARRRRFRPPVGDGRQGSDDALLAPLARRDARGGLARDLFAHLRRRAREVAGAADRVRARRRRFSGDDRAHRPRLRRAARPVRRLQRRFPARVLAADLRRLARARSADAALPRGLDGCRSDRPRKRLSFPARRASPGRAHRFVRIPGGDSRAAAARHGARVARASRRALRRRRGDRSRS